MHAVRFAAAPAEHIGWNVTPYVDGVELAELVASYEKERGFDVVGGYGPLWFDRESWPEFRRLLLPEVRAATGGLGGRLRWISGRRRRVSLLECECEFPGCWPLVARVQRGDGSVQWDSFSNPHRPQRDYSEFGPFEFEFSAYESAIDSLLRR
jgi:hypothetical protein